MRSVHSDRVGWGIEPRKKEYCGGRDALGRLPSQLFLPVCVLARLFRRLFLASLEKAFDAKKLTFYGSLEPLRDRRAFQRYLAPAGKAEWCVYAKSPFAGPEQVLAYVARYTHR